ncbi:MAG: MFS transporter [Treponema sp.]|jgi:fucose permease|nr:MFS transporter [Treponema sp.]
MQKRSRLILLVFILYGTMFLFGFLENIKGVSYPLIKTEFQSSYEQQGIMVSLLSIGYVFCCTIAGIFLGHFGVKRVFLLGFTGLCTGLITVFFMPRFWPVTAALLLVFAGFGFFEIGLNALATQVFTSKAALLMNLLHLFYGLGAVAGPKAAGILTSSSGGPALGWRQVYLWSVPLTLLFFIPALLTRFPGEEAKTGPADRAERTGKTSFLGAVKTPMVWGFGITLGFTIAVEMAAANWGSLYFQDVYGFDPSTAGANFVSVYFILFTVSRLVSGFLIERIGYMRSLLGAAAAIVLILIAGFLCGPRGIWILPVQGFFIAIMWPTLMAEAIGCFGSESPVMTSAIIAIAGTLNALLQLVIGYVNRFLGAAWGYRSCLIYGLIMTALMLLLKNSISRRQKTAVNL